MKIKRDVVQKRIVAFIVSGVLTTAFGLFTLVALVQNSRESKRRYDALVAIDAAGGDVETALNELRGYIYAHMNTSIGSPTGVYPPIQLKGTYDRLVQAEQLKQAANSESLYNEAQADCERRFPASLSGGSRIPCITEYVSSRGGQAVNIPDGLYKFDFVSPRWSPDAAGFGLIVTAVCGLFLIVNGLALLRFRSALKRAF